MNGPLPDTSTWLAVGIAGALGALARFSLGVVTGPRDTAAFPWTTLLVNISGALLLGLVIGRLAPGPTVPPWLRAGLTVGFLGAYTTFSTFSLETVQLAERGRIYLAATYAAVSLVLGVTAVVAGLRLGRLIHG